MKYWKMIIGPNRGATMFFFSFSELLLLVVTGSSLSCYCSSDIRKQVFDLWCIQLWYSQMLRRSRGGWHNVLWMLYSNLFEGLYFASCEVFGGFHTVCILIPIVHIISSSFCLLHDCCELHLWHLG